MNEMLRQMFKPNLIFQRSTQKGKDKMNQRKQFAVLFAGILLGIQSIFGMEGGAVNLLRNPEFRSRGKGKIDFWSIRSGKIETMTADGSQEGVKAIQMPLKPTVSSRFKFGNVLQQSIVKPKAGSYRGSVKLAPSRKFTTAIIILYYADPATGKMVYKGYELKAKEYPAAGKWITKTFSFTIPENLKTLTFAVELRDNQADGFIKIESPSIVPAVTAEKKTEQAKVVKKRSAVPPAAEEILSWPAANQNILVYSTGFENPEAKEFTFYTKTKDGYFVKGAGNTGNTALHIKRKKGEKDVHVRLNLPRNVFKPGAEYLLKVFVRGDIRAIDGKKHGSFRFIQTQYRDRKSGNDLHWSFGVFPFTTYPHDPDSITAFKEFSYRFTGKEGADPFIYFLIVGWPFEGELWFDDLRIYQCGRDAHVNMAKPVMKSFKNGNGEAVFYAVSSGVDSPVMLAEFWMDGKKLKSRVMRPEADGFFRADFGPDLPAGIGEIRIWFGSEEEKLLLKKEVFPVSVLPKDAVPPKGFVSFDKKNRILVDGKPFFGLSLGCAYPPDDRHLRRHAEAGFNVIDTGPFNLVKWNDPEHGKKFLEKLDFLYKNGLKIRLNLCHFYTAPKMGRYYGTRIGKDGLNLEGAVKLVSMVRNHPAILGYYLLDELTEKDWPMVRKLHEAINLADPWHPCFLCTNLRSTLPKISVTGDVVGFDCYPIGKKSAGLTSKSLGAIPEVMNNTARTGLPFFAIPQAFNWGLYNAKTPEEYRLFRDPSENEIFASAVSFAVYGAADYWFFTCPIRHDDIKTSTRFGDPGYAERMFRKTAAAVSRFRKLGPYLISDKEPQWLPVKNNGKGNVLARCFADASGRTAIVIEGKGEADAEISVPAGKNYRSEFGMTVKKENGKYRFVSSYFGADVLYECRKP